VDLGLVNETVSGRRCVPLKTRMTLREGLVGRFLRCICSRLRFPNLDDCINQS